ncbi:MAG: hypothetical protein HY297_04065 [Thaumarchaeota archaeon]|nr:hypothetical protein [Nitrososphaerota archaeon]
MATEERDVKKAAELKLWIEEKIAEHLEEIDRLRETLGYVDATLRASTFKTANELMAESREAPEIREIKRDKGGQTLATAMVTPYSVSVEPVEGVGLKTATPPFKSFLVAKILQGMKSKDAELVGVGKLVKGMELRFDVEERNGVLGKIIVENYREKTRLTEILNTISWTFSRMLEKSAPG